jgi:hypothetical protein
VRQRAADPHDRDLAALLDVPEVRLDDGVDGLLGAPA